MSKVSNILARKGNQVAIVSPDTSVIDALKMMAEKNIGSVVVAENEKLFSWVETLLKHPLVKS